MHPFISKNFLYYPVQSFRKEKVRQYLKEVKQTEWLGKEELISFKKKKLKELLTYVSQNIPFYINLFKKDNLSLHMPINELLSRLPIMTKSNYSKVLKELISIKCKEKLDWRMTSGSSGIPLSLLKGRSAYARNRAIMYRYYSWYGIDIGDRQGRFFGHPVTFFSRLKEDIQDFILNKYRLDPVYLTPEIMEKFYKKIQKVGPIYFYGYTSAICEFAKFLVENHLDPKKIDLKAIICTGEIVYENQKELLKSIFDRPVVNEYGCSELGVIAFECPEGKLHLSEDNLYVEILKNSSPVNEGESGEVIITELFNMTVPLIRYQLGDMLKIATNQECACGRSLQIIDSIEGRTSQFIQLKNGRLIHTEVFHYISDAFTEKGVNVEQFRVIQKQIGSFMLEIVPKTNNCHAQPKVRDKDEKIIKELFQNVLSSNIEIDFKYVSAIPRDPSGKLRYFISEV